MAQRNTSSSVMQNNFWWYHRCVDNSGIAHPHGISLDGNNTRLLISKNETKHNTTPYNAQFRPAESEIVRIIAAQWVQSIMYTVCCILFIAHPVSRCARPWPSSHPAAGLRAASSSAPSLLTRQRSFLVAGSNNIHTYIHMRHTSHCQINFKKWF